MNNSYSHYFVIALILLCCFSCENEESLIGESFVVSDKHTIVSYPQEGDDFSMTSESVKNSNMLALAGDTSLLGYYNDPIFGETTAGFSFQIKPLNLIENDWNLDNIEGIYLNIPYMGFYGKSELDPNSVDFLISAMVSENLSVENNNTYIHDLPTFDLQEGIMQNLGEIENELVLNITTDDLKISLFEEFEDNQDLDVIQNNFLTTAPSLMLFAAAPSDGAIMYLSTSTAFFDIVCKYDDETRDTIKFDIDSNELIKMNFFNSLGMVDVDGVNNLENNDNVLCLQSMGGAFSIIDMPFLDGLKEQGYIAVNNAELIFHVSEENGNFPLPDKLKLYEYLEDGSSSNLDEDDSVEESCVFNEEDNTYKLDLTSHIQDIIENEMDSKFRLYIDSTTSAINRLVLDKSFELNLLLIKETE